ncbi:MAG: extracellular solute-binding protein [Paraglaciecola sp.]|nr:extracellular solute-binding protein [Paraglaciecola sp.]NCT48217.1 extracellular solute-binding protein [Paraglaciecola sp.]
MILKQFQQAIFPLIMAISHSALRCTLVCLCSVLTSAYCSASITIAVLTDSPTERGNFSALGDQFTAENPDIGLNFIAYRSPEYKVLVSEWLAKRAGPDVFFWHGGERLQQFVRGGLVANLDDMWQDSDFSRQFTPALTDLVSYHDSKYAVPISYYHWGFFYKKSLFRRLNLATPTSWQDFLHVCATLKQHNINPIAIGSMDPWTVAAWFDYLNLRLNGNDFHQALLRGEIEFTDQRVVHVFEYWQKLLKNDYFLQGHEKLNWNEALPFIFRELSGFTLIGNFAATRLPDSMQEEIGFFPFPQINPSVGQTEEAPTDVFFINAKTKNLAHAKRFMQFVARADVQAQYNNYAAGFPANINAETSLNYFNAIGYELLKNADSLSQFFDRQTPDVFSKPAMALMVAFMLNMDVANTVQQLEVLRHEHLLADEKDAF